MRPRSPAVRAVAAAIGALALLAFSAPSPASPPGTEPKDPSVETTAPHEEPPGEPGPTGPQAAAAAHCEGGFAGPFPCREIDLLAFVPAAELAGEAATTNDVWGWTDPSTGREYALVGLSNGVAFVDVTEPAAPRPVGHLPTRTVASIWRGVKSYRDHAYVVADRAGVHGLQVFDLTRLRGVSVAQRFTPERVYFGAGSGVAAGETLGSAHNVAIDEESGFAYVVGSATCAGGLHMVDLERPARPRFAGCFAADGYTHDVQCVVYRGPDGAHRGRQICFAANEDTLTLVDVTDKRAPRQLSRTGYAGSGYTHQGWLTEDHRYLLVDDELDEMRFGHGSRTYVWDVADLDAPRLIGVHTAASPATDHNLYVAGALLFEANYRSGLRIFDLARVGEGRLREVAFFDVVPESDAAGFAGAWTVYPFFASGTVLVTGIEQGLFVLRPHYEELP
jgi:choice-of-anchor B domain-containing protein